MNAPAEIEPIVERTLSRVARELEQIADALERLETLVALIASAARAAGLARKKDHNRAEALLIAL
jgi:hypothetical protein